MKCPACDVNLTMSERQGIEIDYCPQCRGVWLDRGELDKIIDRSIASTGGQTRPADPAGDHYDQRRTQQDPYRAGHYKKKKREGFLSDLFDFD